jgi:hypothetical protein
MLLGKITIGDWLTATIGILSLAVPGGRSALCSSE